MTVNDIQWQCGMTVSSMATQHTAGSWAGDGGNLTNCGIEEWRKGEYGALRRGRCCRSLLPFAGSLPQRAPPPPPPTGGMARAEGAALVQATCSSSCSR
jgi:hypothetical protein